MEENTTTVEVTQVVGYPAVRMTWQHMVKIDDLQPAFQQVTKALNVSSERMYVIVDLRSDPNFPIVDTVMGALRGPFRNPNLEEWLVICGNRAARMIGNMLTKATRRENIRWFDTIESAMTYLDTKQNSMATNQ